MRKLLMLAASALAALAFVGLFASSATADVPLEARYHGTEEPCEELNMVPEGFALLYYGGGCVVEGFDGSVDLYGGNPHGFVNNFDMDFDLAVGPDGMAYAVNQDVDSGSGAMMQRRACTVADGTRIPWPVEITGDGDGEFSATLQFCLALASGSPGSPGAWAAIPLDVAHVGGDGWTELVQSDPLTYWQNGYWSSDGTVDLVEIEE